MQNNNYYILEDKMVPTGESNIYNGYYQVIGFCKYQTSSIWSEIVFMDGRQNLQVSGKRRFPSMWPVWYMYDQNQTLIGSVRRRLTIRREYIYEPASGQKLTITGDFTNRKFNIYVGKTLIAVISRSSEVVNLKPYNFIVETYDLHEIPVWVILCIVQGVRSLNKYMGPESSERRKKS